jgi:hypothetical protein
MLGRTRKWNGLSFGGKFSRSHDRMGRFNRPGLWLPGNPEEAAKV